MPSTAHLNCCGPRGDSAQQQVSAAETEDDPVSAIEGGGTPRPDATGQGGEIQGLSWDRQELSSVDNDEWSTDVAIAPLALSMPSAVAMRSETAETLWM